MSEKIKMSTEDAAIVVEKAIEIMKEAEKRLIEKEAGDLEKNIKYLTDVLSSILEKSGAKQFEKWQSKMKEIAQKNPSLLIRRENPEKLLRAIGNRDNLNINFGANEQHAEEKYPNAAELGTDLQGLKIPATLGFGSLGKGTVVFMVGFKPEKKMAVDHIPTDKFLHLKGEDRSRMRMVEGNIPFKNIKFILCRFPYHLFPKNQMTEDEIKLGEEAEEDKQLLPISRLYLINE